jgi:hypothetical protein
MEENEWEKIDVEEFTRLVEQSEQELTKEELDTVDVGIGKDKKEFKIGTLITSGERGLDLITARVCRHVYLDLHRYA